MSYVELHCHSSFSFNDGASSPMALVLQAKKLGYDALAVTDQDNLAGAMEFAQAAHAWELQPITGAEVTVTGGHHLSLLAETPTGYANLSRLMTRANLSNERDHPVIDPAWLKGASEGLIALSGCCKGEVPALIEAGEVRRAYEVADYYRGLFGRDNFFIELQDHQAYGDEERNNGLTRLARDIGLGCVATNNVHYHVRERHRLHDVRLAIGQNKSLDEVRHLLRPNSEFYLKSPQEMERLFDWLPEAVENGGHIAQRCSFDITRDLTYRFPDYEPEDGRTADEFLAGLCFRRVRELYGSNQDVEQRLREELALIEMGHQAGFFLRLWELLKIAHESDMPVRGRGSAVGSLVCYLLGLSGIDPIKYDLFVGRFLNEARLSEDLPDIDLDFGRKAREEMFETIFDRYTTAHAAQVCNVIEYRFPSAIRDVGKALGLPQADLDQLAKRMRLRFSASFARESVSVPEGKRRQQSPTWRNFNELVGEILGFPQFLGQHSGGVILSTTRIDEQVPVQVASMEGRFIGQWDKDSVADARMFKLDLLGYPSLDHLYIGLRYVEERHGKTIRPEDIPLDDERVYAMIQDADVLGVVQIQSRAQQQVLNRIPIRNIDDLVVQVALIRPGPIQGGAVNPYIARCLGHEPITYDHPSLKPVLEETKGVFIFQEQVIQAGMAIAGFTTAQAELLRKAMGRKRSQEAMEALQEQFLIGAMNQGVPSEVAGTVYGKILAFAEFGFPKSHAAAMAETAYKVAWLRRYYPVEFFTALLNNQPMGFYEPEVICNEARRHDIEILLVDVNQSRSDCTIESDTSLRIGFRYVRDLGPGSLQMLDEEATNGPYRSLWDFWQRTGLPRKPIENLIRLGAFAWTGLHERELLWLLGTFYQPLQIKKKVDARQLPLQLPAGQLVTLPKMTYEQRIIVDLLLTGIAARGRTIDLVADQLNEGMTPSYALKDKPVGSAVTVAGIVAVRQAPETAKGFVFHTLEDGFGLLNVITRPDLLPKYREIIERAPAIIVHGHIERQERATNVIAERFEALSIKPEAEKGVHDFG
jgi:error-prone DNA polymerase